MQRQDYCVYNQTNECFLSLGATLGDRPFARLKQRLHIGRRRADEGNWFKPFQRQRAITLFATRDLLYLDARHRVLHVIEAFPSLRVVPPHQDAVSLLALPVHAISSSQTKPGNQLLICAPMEMERRLRSLFEPKYDVSRQLNVSPATIHAPEAQPQQQLAPAMADPGMAVTVRVQRDAYVPTPAPAPIAHGAELSAHAIRDLSASGLYLITRDRWPIGAEINMNLQPGGVTDTASSPVTVRMRVTRWGADGVALEFAGADAESSDTKSLYVC